MSESFVHTRGERLLRAVVVAIGVAFTLFPLLVLLAGSFRTAPDFFSSNLLPKPFTTEHYRALLSSGSGPLLALQNSLVVTAFTVVLATALGTIAAYGLARLRYGWVAALALLVLAVRFYPKITTILPYYVLVKDVGLLDSQLAIIVAHVSIALPLVILLMIGFFREVPAGIEEAAVLDGASPLQVFRYVALPIVRPGIATSAVLVALMSWNEFLLASSVASDQAKTLPILIASFTTDKGTNLGALSAVAVLVVLPLLLFMVFAQRMLVRGMTLGAVKQ